MKLLFATDGSAVADHALDAALGLVAHPGLEIDVVAVTDLAPTSGLEVAYGGATLAIAREVGATKELLEDTLRRIVRTGVPATVHDRVGEPAWQVIDAAEHLQADLVVMGTVPRTWLERAFVGSVSDRVVHGWRGAALVVPDRAPLPGKDQGLHVLIAIDGSPAAFHALDEACRLLPLGKARVTVASVVDVLPEALPGLPESPTLVHLRANGERDLALARERLASRGIKAEVVSRDGRPGRVLCELAQECMADLIVLGSPGHNALERLWLGSTSDHVLHNGRTATFLAWSAT